MLLNHTSGIREMTEILEPDKVVENVKGRFNFEPGKGWADTNSDYIMAGLIIEQVTGKKAHEVIREKIIDPLELKNTFMKGYEEYPKNREVKGHNFNKYGELQPYTFDRKTWTAGSMVSNAGDLFKYAYALFNGEILSEKSYKQMIEPAAEDITYGPMIFSSSCLTTSAATLTEDSTTGVRKSGSRSKCGYATLKATQTTSSRQAI